MQETNGYNDTDISTDFESGRVISKGAYNLELDRNDPEVEYLHRRPQHKVGLQGRQIDVTELLRQCPLSTSLGNRHISEEARETYQYYISMWPSKDGFVGRFDAAHTKWCKDELIECHTLKNWCCRVLLGQGKGSR